MFENIGKKIKTFAKLTDAFCQYLHFHTSIVCFFCIITQSDIDRLRRLSSHAQTSIRCGTYYITKLTSAVYCRRMIRHRYILGTTPIQSRSCSMPGMYARPLCLPPTAFPAVCRIISKPNPAIPCEVRSRGFCLPPCLPE